MGNYITSQEVIAFVGNDCDELTGTIIAGMATSIFNQLIDAGDEGIAISEKIDYYNPERDFWTQTTWFWFKSNVGKVFMLRNVKPVSITSVNSVSAGTIDVDYTLQGRRLEFKYLKPYPTDFPYRYKVVYQAGYTTIPEDVKSCCLYLAMGLFIKKKFDHVESFRQDLLSVNFSKWNWLLDLALDPTQRSFIQLIVSKYIVPYYNAI